ELRQGPAPASHGHRTRRGARTVPRHQYRDCIQGGGIIMLTPERAEDIFSKLRRFSEADEIELLISGTRTALTRFANNTIHQNVAEEQYQISVRTSFGGRTARASTNKH